MVRPSETVTGIVGSVVGSILSLLAAFGINIPDGVPGPLVALVGWVAAAVTWWVARQQRAGTKVSASDGKVVDG